jgi:hypothetical protein
MATCNFSEATLHRLDLPAEFEDLSGLVSADLRAIVAMLAHRANERLLTTRHEHHQLQVELWNGLTTAINDAVAPLSADLR